MGRATRLARFIEGAEKCYDAVVRFGMATDTDDVMGSAISERMPHDWPTRDALERAAAALLGPQSQVPPAYSAKHVAGTRSYLLARAGKAVELAPVEVMVHALDLIEWTPPDLRFTARVGRGTYIRALARDLGERIDIPAHCAELRRASIGPFLVANAIAPELVSAESLVTPAQLLQHLPTETVGNEAERELGFGRTLVQQAAVDGFGGLLGSDGRLIAVAEGRDGIWHPVVVLEPAA